MSDGRTIVLWRSLGMLGLALGAAAFVPIQPVRAGGFGPVAVFSGTWVAESPGAAAPFVTLTLRGAQDGLSGTLTRFAIAIAGNRITGTALGAPPSALGDVRVRDGEVQFSWSGEEPLRGGTVRFVLQGTDVGYLVLPASAGEIDKLLAANPAASGFSPVIAVRRRTEGSEGSSPPPRSAASEDWEATATARLVNAAELQYRFVNHRYVGYDELVRSRLLRKTAARQFTVVAKTLDAVDDQLPGYAVRVTVSAYGDSYQLSIVRRSSGAPSTGIFSDESGTLFEGTASK
jgi:hypothetical protein